MSAMKIEDKLAVNKFDIDKEFHIQLKEEACQDCDVHSCLYACPADCFKLTEDERITFAYEGCLECGSCRLICDKDAIEWTLPRAGFGICYQYG
jgi:ferredoxin like protein